MRFVIRKKPSAHYWAEGFLNLQSTHFVFRLYLSFIRQPF